MCPQAKPPFLPVFALVVSDALVWLGMVEAVQLEIFGVSAVEPPWRDNRDAMEYPFLALQKKRIKPIEYSARGIHISINSDQRFSIATIWDWDLIIFAASHLNDAIEAGIAAVATNTIRSV